MTINKCFTKAITHEIARIMNADPSSIQLNRTIIGVNTDKMVAVEIRVGSQHLLAYMTFWINEGKTGARLHMIEFYEDTEC